MSAAAVVAQFLEGIEPERISWRWKGRLAAGKVTVLEGDPGLGKTTLGLDLAARLSRGKALPGGEAGKPLVVGIVSDEDGLRDTILPRLRLADADMSKVCQLTGRTPLGHKRSLLLPDDADEIISAVRQLGIGHLYIDPLAAHAGPSVRLNTDQDVRAKVMGPLAVIGEETGVSCILTRHLNKQPGDNPLYRGGGSIGIIGAARFGLLAGRHPEDPAVIVLAPTKHNIGPPPPSLAYRLIGDPSGDHASVVWEEGTCSLTARDLLAAPPPEAAKEATAAGRWLIVQLATGAKAVEALQEAAEKAGHGWRSVERAKKELAVERQRVGFGPGSVVFWLLPGQEAPRTTDNGHRPPSEESLASMAVYGDVEAGNDQWTR
jgi:hypothetical protein